MQSQCNRLLTALAGPHKGLVLPRRNFFAYFRIAFNSVDAERLQEVGADRLCAEWLLKNGASVKLAGKSMVSDYNSLEPASAHRRSIEQVTAEDASIMAMGFDHFKGCKDIRRIELIRCKHLENEALAQLKHVKNSLVELKIADCFNVNDSGLKSLGDLNNLSKLEVSGLPYVNDLNDVKSELNNKLPNCEISLSQ